MMVPMLIHPVSRYKAETGVEFGVERILLISDLSNISRSSKSLLVILYQSSELVRRELRKMLSLNRKAILK